MWAILTFWAQQQLRFKKHRVNRPLLLHLDKLRKSEVVYSAAVAYQLEIDNRFKELERERERERERETHTPNEM